MHIMNLAEFESRVSDVHDFLSTNPAAKDAIRVLDDLHGFLGSEVRGWTTNEDIVAAYDALRGQRDRLEGGEDVMDRVRSAVDRLLDSIRAARPAEA
jgi:hypothetical protein